MSSRISCLKVFLASPSGLADERKAFREEIQDYNQEESIPRGVLFQAVGWEDTLGAVGRPQTIINEDVRASDYFILLLWNHWGSSPDIRFSRFTSGTEEEFNIAMGCYKSKEFPMRQLVMMFKSVEPQQMGDPGPQLQKVIDFRRKIEREKTHLFHSFDTTGNFRKLLRKHLAMWLRDEEKGCATQKELPLDVGPLVVGNSVMIPKQQFEKSSDKSLVDNAWVLADEGRLTEAEVEFTRLIAGKSQTGPMIEFGRFLVRLGRLEQAIVMFEGAARVAVDQKDSSAISRAQRSLGDVLLTRGDLAGAEEMFRKSLEIDEKLGCLEGMATDYGNLGNVLLTRGDLAGAEKMFRKSLEIDEKLGCLEGMADDHVNLGTVLRIRGDLTGAEQMYRKALEIDEKLGRLEGMANAYGNLGNVVLNRRDLTGAEQMYRKALDIEEKLGRLEGMANAYGNLGIVLRMRGDLTGAEKMFRKSLEIDEKLGCLEGMATNCGNMGNILLTQGDLTGAEKMYRKSLEIDEKLGRLEGMANAYGNLAMLLRTQGDLIGAEQMCRKALEIEERLGRVGGMANAYGNLAMLLRTRGDLIGAAQMFRSFFDVIDRQGSSQRIEKMKALLDSLLKVLPETTNAG